ncbi:MAG: hypothetical protein Q9165_002692 [Trypethelium subeluteriae]
MPLFAQQDVALAAYKIKTSQVRGFPIELPHEDRSLQAKSQSSSTRTRTKMNFRTLLALAFTAVQAAIAQLLVPDRVVATSVEDQLAFARSIESNVTRGFVARFSNEIETIKNRVPDIDDTVPFLIDAIKAGYVQYIASVLEDEMVILHAARAAAKTGVETPKELAPILLEIQALLGFIDEGMT